MSSISSAFKDRRRTEYLITGVLLCVVLVFFIVMPVVSVFSQSFMNKKGDFTFHNYYDAFSTKETLEAISNSLLLGVSVTPLSTFIAVP